ncbi:MAG: monoamine oxidase [Arenicella sp.]|jgi:monoamine oxidase
MQTVIIIGGGISGLHTAYELANRGVEFKLLEATSRLGGRILSSPGESDLLNTSRYDLGPSWFWPGQTAIESLIHELGLKHSVFEQYAVGDSLFEPTGAPLQRGVRGISMQGSLRIKDGWETVIESLVSAIIELTGNDTILCEHMVNSIEHKSDGVQLRVANSAQVFSAQHVILAMPSRVVLKSLTFSPELAKSRIHELNNLATWMAGHAKAVCIYEQAFWREAGFSGDVISQRGPLAEIHDASPIGQNRHALFGFLATPPAQRNYGLAEIKRSIIQQLVRLFGEKAQNPLDILYQDWAKNPYLATELDQQIANHHSLNSLSTIKEVGWGQRLIWSGTEAAQGHIKGYIEGAITASQNALAAIR